MQRALLARLAGPEALADFPDFVDADGEWLLDCIEQERIDTAARAKP